MAEIDIEMPIPEDEAAWSIRIAEGISSRRSDAWPGMPNQRREQESGDGEDEMQERHLVPAGGRQKQRIAKVDVNPSP